jgi:hypothetical protein
VPVDVAVDCCVTVGWVCEVVAVVCEGAAMVCVVVAVVCVAEVELAAVWELVPVVVTVPVVVAADAPVLVVVAAAGGAGAPGVGGSVEVPGPVISAPFLGGSITNAAESGVWMLASAPATSPVEEDVR